MCGLTYSKSSERLRNYLIAIIKKEIEMKVQASHLFPQDR